MQKHLLLRPGGKAYIRNVTASINQIPYLHLTMFSLIYRCNISSILLEMDRILRPGGKAYIRDKKETIQEIKEITDAMGWRATIRDTSEGPYASRKVLMCDKPMVR
jgi:ubiquinone/menaquinone biosynthesis C-methylase UbiE